jgi:ATPase subunit of ABC transporter with duplicated ATPase domains
VSGTTTQPTALRTDHSDLARPRTTGNICVVLEATPSTPTTQQQPALLTLSDASALGVPSTVFRPHNVQIPCGLTVVTGDEGTGKTTILRMIAGDLRLSTGSRSDSDGLWMDLRLPEHDEHRPDQVWDALAARYPRWNMGLRDALIDGFELREHLDKRLFMLSTGSRRKVALVALLCSGATVTCIDQPYAGLDHPSIQLLRAFLQDQSKHASRAWVVADYEADPGLDWRHTIALSAPTP